MNHIGMVTGLAVAFWVGYGFSGWTTKHGQYVGWRASITLQYIPAAVFMLGLPFVKETYVEPFTSGANVLTVLGHDGWSNMVA
jgi:hypothetical protein